MIKSIAVLKKTKTKKLKGLQDRLARLEEFKIKEVLHSYWSMCQLVQRIKLTINWYWTREHKLDDVVRLIQTNSVVKH